MRRGISDSTEVMGCVSLAGPVASKFKSTWLLDSRPGKPAWASRKIAGPGILGPCYVDKREKGEKEERTWFCALPLPHLFLVLLKTTLLDWSILSNLFASILLSPSRVLENHCGSRRTQLWGAFPKEAGDCLLAFELLILILSNCMDRCLSACRGGQKICLKELCMSVYSHRPKKERTCPYWRGNEGIVFTLPIY